MRTILIVSLLVLISSCGTNRLRLVNKRHHTIEAQNQRSSTTKQDYSLKKENDRSYSFNDSSHTKEPLTVAPISDNGSNTHDNPFQTDELTPAGPKQQETVTANKESFYPNKATKTLGERTNSWGWAFILGGLILGFAVIQYTRLVSFSIPLIFIGGLLGLGLIIIGLVRIFKKTSGKSPKNREKFWSWFFITVGLIGILPSIILWLVSPLLFILGILICAGLITLGIYRLIQKRQ